MNEQTIIIGMIFGAVLLAAYAVSAMLSSQNSKLRDRLGSGGRTRDTAGGTGAGVVQVLQSIGEAASTPFMPSSREKESTLRQALGQAGIYSPGALRLVIGSKMILLVAGVTGGYLAGVWMEMAMLGAALGGLIGYLLPVIWLRQRIKANQRALAYGLPDALDLMVVCVEAGLTVDSAMQRVGQEVALAHPRLSRELAIAHMETRMGLSRAEALRNLAARTGSEALQSLVAMLVQADRFGTSIASALRIHADSLRSQRQHAAEEMAAKASVKMSFPLVLFIFPATFIVLAGPTVIGLLKSDLMK